MQRSADLRKKWCIGGDGVMRNVFTAPGITRREDNRLRFIIKDTEAMGEGGVRVDRYTQRILERLREFIAKLSFAHCETRIVVSSSGTSYHNRHLLRSPAVYELF
jgi:hypothetical protein